MQISQSLPMTYSNRVYATGVFLQAVEVLIDGKKQWRWIAVGFEDDTYFDGKTIELYDYANSFEGLFRPME
jgi:hypothetical protein